MAKRIDLYDQSWIKLYRKALESGWLQNPKLWTFWSYLLLKASHKKYKQIVGYQTVELEPGQLIFGRKKASKELKISEQTIRTCLNYLSQCQNITIKSTSKFSIVNICNWETYQGGNNGKLTINPTSDQPASNQQVTTNKNVKNIKNVKKEYILSGFPTEIAGLYNLFLSTLTEKELSIYEPKTDKLKFEWYDCLDKCNRIDGFQYWQIGDIICEMRIDKFWKDNFKSPLKLRELDKTAKVNRIKVWWDKYESDARNNNEIIKGPEKDGDLEYIENLISEHEIE